MKPAGKRTWSPVASGLVVAVLVFAAVVGLRNFGKFQLVELLIYDRFLKARAGCIGDDPRIALIEITEADIGKSNIGWPLTDDTLSELLEALEAQEPCAIGLDLFRDLPVPPTSVNKNKLEETLTKHDNIIAAWRFGDGSTPSIRPPKCLATNEQRIGFVDFPVDDKVDNIVRRGFLFLDDGKHFYESLALRLAKLYLETKNVSPEADPNEPANLRLGKTTFRPFEKTDGPYVNVDAQGYQFVFDFKCSERFDVWSITNVLAGLPPKTLQGKILLVGVTASTVKDYFATPLRFDHRGFEVHALAVNQLLRAALDGDGPIRVWDDWQELGFIFCLSVTGAAIGLWVRTPWRTTVLIVLSLMGLGLIGWLAFRSGWWIPVATPGVACLLSAALMTSGVSYREQAHRRLLMKVFAAHVSPRMAEAIWDQRDALLEGNHPRSQKLTATILFTDLVDFASLSEGMDPAFLLDWLNEFMGAMSKVIDDNGGLVEKFIGDAIMAGFGIPLPRATDDEMRKDAANAVRCALAMAEELNRLNTRWKQKGFPTACMRIGIATGPLVVGSLGSADRREYTVLGDTVNTASRLEGFDKDKAKLDVNKEACRVLIAQSTFELLDAQFETELVGRIKLKGKKDEVTVFRAIGKKHSLERNLP